MSEAILRDFGAVGGGKKLSVKFQTLPWGAALIDQPQGSWPHIEP